MRLMHKTTISIDGVPEACAMSIKEGLEDEAVDQGTKTSGLHLRDHTHFHDH